MIPIIIPIIIPIPEEDCCIEIPEGTGKIFLWWLLLNMFVGWPSCYFLFGTDWLVGSLVMAVCLGNFVSLIIMLIVEFIRTFF